MSEELKNYKSELSLRNKIGRLVWGGVYVLFFRISLRPFFKWRNFLLRLFGAKIGKNVKVYNSATIYAPWNLEMKAGSVLGDNVDCYCVDKVILEEDAWVSQYSHLCTASHDIRSRGRELIHKPIVLKRGSWVFSGAFVGPGVTIGENAVVAARGVVVKDVDAFAIVGGNPVKFIGKREFKN